MHAWPTVYCGHALWPTVYCGRLCTVANCVRCPRFYRDGELVLAPCRVEEYDDDEQQYLIKWDSTRKTKWVKRLNLCFAAEDQQLWQQRQETASRRKAAQECRARLVKYVNEVRINSNNPDYSLVCGVRRQMLQSVLSIVTHLSFTAMI